MVAPKRLAPVPTSPGHPAADEGLCPLAAHGHEGQGGQV